MHKLIPILIILMAGIIGYYVVKWVYDAYFAGGGKGPNPPKPPKVPLTPIQQYLQIIYPNSDTIKNMNAASAATYYASFYLYEPTMINEELKLKLNEKNITTNTILINDKVEFIAIAEEIIKSIYWDNILDYEDQYTLIEAKSPYTLLREPPLKYKID